MSDQRPRGPQRSPRGSPSLGPNACPGLSRLWPPVPPRPALARTGGAGRQRPQACAGPGARGHEAPGARPAAAARPAQARSPDSVSVGGEGLCWAGALGPSKRGRAGEGHPDARGRTSTRPLRPDGLSSPAAGASAHPASRPKPGPVQVRPCGLLCAPLILEAHASRSVPSRARL